MQKIQLYIEGQRVDLFDDESVVLTQTIQNVKDVQKVFTDYSKTFTLPATKENNKIFKHYYNNSITNGFDGRSRVSATLELNHLKFKKGKIKLEGVDLKNNVPSSYKVRFTGNTVTLKDLLGEDKLGALTDLNSNTLVYNAANVKTKLKANPATSDIIAPLITHTQRLVYNSHSSANESGNVYYESRPNRSDKGKLLGIEGNLSMSLIKRLEDINKEIEKRQDVIANVIQNKTYFVNKNGKSWYPKFMKLAKSHIAELKKHKIEIKKLV